MSKKLPWEVADIDRVRDPEPGSAEARSELAGSVVDTGGSDPGFRLTERDDRDLWQGHHDGPRAIKLIQGYAWHPREAGIDLRALLPKELGEGVHLLIDPMPQAPFTFFEDGTMSATQQVYQVTVLAIVQPGQDPARLLPVVAEELQPHLAATPQGVGWQLMEDLREVG